MQKALLRNGRKHHSEYDLAADYQNIKDALSEATIDVKGRLGEIFTNRIDDAKEKSHDLKAQFSDYVVKEPLKSIGIAAASGIIFGFLLRRR